MTKKRVTLLTSLAVIVFSAGVYLHVQDTQTQVAKKAQFFNLLAVQAQETEATAAPEVAPDVTTDAPPDANAPKALALTGGNLNYFLKVDGIPGDSVNKNHPNEIEPDSYSWGVRNQAFRGGGGGGGAGRSIFDTFFVTMKLSKATPLLFLNTAKGTHIKEVVLSLNNKQSGKDFYRIKLSDVLISSYKEASGELLPAVQVGLTFSKIELSYYPQKDDGSLGTPITAGWDLKANKAL